MQRAYKLTFDRGETELREHLSPDEAVVKFAEQDGRLCLWFIDRDGAQPRVERHFSIRGTGHDIDESAVYIDTAFLGPFVFHLFENPTGKAA